MRKAICWWIPLMYLLISDMFYLRTYDSAQVKITLLQMGGFSLLGMWASLLILEGKKAFSKADMLMLSPFLAYLAYVWLSFIHAPYHGPSVDDLVRYTLYMSVSVIVIREFSKKDIDRLTKILLITGYISILYGFVQFLDTRFFPSKEMGGSGLDPFLWRWAFGKRVFSTYGNPNFFGNFLVLILPIAVAQYLKRKNILLIPLILLDLLCMYATETKGAWLGFAVTFFIFCVFYGYFFLREKLKISKAKFLGFAAIIPVLAFSAVIVYSYLRPQSVSFRVATWLSTWEIAETHPLMGIGAGSFKVIYPAYRRPVIFHIEGRHNTETDHAEQEHLEQFMDNGILGAGIYFWLIIFVSVVGLKSLSVKTASLSSGDKASDDAYDILGYLSAFLGMLAHNCTDVSMRFVSSGIFLGLLPGIIVNIARGRGLWELHFIKDSLEKKYDGGLSFWGKIRAFFAAPAVSSVLVWTARIAVCCAVLYFAFLLFKEFNFIQGDGNLYSASGERLQWNLSWIVFSAVVIAGSAVFIVASFKSKSAAASLMLILSLFPSYYFWGWFKADAYHNIAIYMSKLGKWSEAISYYGEVSKYNKFFIMPYYFVGNVFNDRFDMKNSYRPELGDKDYMPRNDFERAVEYYDKVASIAPNYVQMHHQRGVLHLKLHDYYAAQGKLEEAEQASKKALEYFQLYEKLDPVFDNNYYRKAQIYLMSKDYDKALNEYEHYIYAWKCFQKDHKHESTEAYLNYGNALFMAGRYKKAVEAYHKALEFDPKSEYVLHNLNIAEKMDKTE
ncbi:MAG: tetratricopeptide repeat protein [Elusimicrobiales bacterium]|nr:tetratricopeptide repeat protein [Elusimicrobiales bacterium]